MSKRPSRPSDAGPSKKRAKKNHTFGAPTADDEDFLLSQLSAPTAKALSTRHTSTGVPPSLVNICARNFVTNLRFLFESHREETQQWLKLLPERLVPGVFAMLSSAHPTLMSHPFITAYFLRGDPIVLSGGGVSADTLHSLAALPNPPKEVRLLDLDKISDNNFARLFKIGDFSGLEVLKLRGCSKVGAATLDAVTKHCPALKHINLGFTAATPDAIAKLTARLPNLEVLKLAGISQISDSNLSSIVFHIGNGHKFPEGSTLLPQRLKSLKLRHTKITDKSIAPLAAQCSLLTRLDVSFTNIHHPTLNINIKDLSNFATEVPSLFRLEKLSVTSTPLTSQYLQSLTTSGFLPTMRDSLRVLHMGALGGSPTGGSVLQGNLALTDEILGLITDNLAEFTALEDISLVGNNKLGFSVGIDAPLTRFIMEVGRRCRILNLSGIARLKSSHLAGLLSVSNDPSLDTPSALEHLSLSNTDVGDEAAPYIASCKNLETLELAGAKFSEKGLFEIIDACPGLNSLDLTSCRGVKVQDRRRFFEMWEENRVDE